MLILLTYLFMNFIQYFIYFQTIFCEETLFVPYHTVQSGCRNMPDYLNQLQHLEEDEEEEKEKEEGGGGGSGGGK